jgi:predicted negative regulator of RcsB-dependent stress response
MQTQDAPAEILFKFWPWLEANKNRLIAGVVAILAAWAIYAFVSWRHEQKEVAAGQALSQLLVTASPGAAGVGQMVDAFARLAAQYPGTAAGERAQLQAAAALFNAGRYADAQAQFQKFLAGNSTSPLASTAQLGVATSLEAQGKPEAVSEYQKVVSRYSGSACEQIAKGALARLQPAAKPATAPAATPAAKS